MTNKALAKFGKSKGYEYLATIVKSHFNTNYYNINKLDDIIKTGKIRPAPFMGNLNCKQGVRTSQLPGKTVTRTLLRFMYKKEIL